MMKQGLQAEVRWFDYTSGEGMVRLNDGRSVFMHFTAIQGIDKNNHQWPTNDDQLKLRLIAGKRCLVDLIEDTTFTQVGLCFIPEMEG